MTAQKLTIALKRAYVEPAASDGTRVLVERLWPRGISKERAHIDLWLKEVAPSTELRKWYNHDVQQFQEFRRRYEIELHSEAAQKALARDPEHSSAAILQDILLHSS